MLNFIKEQDEYLGWLRNEIVHRVLPLWINGMVAVGIIGEALALIFRDKEIKKLMKANLGYYGWIFRHKERRELKAKMQARCEEIVEVWDFDSDEAFERFMPMS